MPSVGKHIPHDSALGHVTGQALYLDDAPEMVGELHVGFVPSPIAAGVLHDVDAAEALAVPGVVAVYTCDDVPGHNMFGPLAADEPFCLSAAKTSEPFQHVPWRRTGIFAFVASTAGGLGRGCSFLRLSFAL